MEVAASETLPSAVSLNKEFQLILSNSIFCSYHNTCIDSRIFPHPPTLYRAFVPFHFNDLSTSPTHESSLRISFFKRINFTIQVAKMATITSHSCFQLSNLHNVSLLSFASLSFIATSSVGGRSFFELVSIFILPCFRLLLSAAPHPPVSQTPEKRFPCLSSDPFFFFSISLSLSLSFFYSMGVHDDQKPIRVNGLTIFFLLLFLLAILCALT